jgi:hypothetical protein
MGEGLGNTNRGSSVWAEFELTPRLGCLVGDGLDTNESCQFKNQSARRDNSKHGLPAGNERCVNPGVERGETPPVFHGKGQKKVVGEMLGRRQPGLEPVIRQRQVIRPEMMPWCRHQASKHPARFHWVAQRSRVRWMAEDAEEGILCCRTGSPATSDSLALKEVHGSAFMHVPGVAQGDEHTGVQERDHGRWGWVIR